MVHNVKLGKNMRSVSIVGIGATPFFNGVQNETYKGLTNGELFGHAALDAMKDAGVEPRDVQYFFHGSANPHVLNNCITPNLQVADWFGMRGKDHYLIRKVAVPVTLHWRKQYSQSPVERMMLCLQDAANREQECQMETHRIICVFHLLQKYYSRIWIPSLTVLMEDTLEVVLV